MEIVCIGNELLIGKTVNTNATWLANRITCLGGEVKTIITVGDELEEIRRGLDYALNRKPDLIITTGGLGPTFDDKTLEGVAYAMGRPLEINQDALNMVRRKYEAYYKEGRMEKVEITAARRKMAILPSGSKPLYNPVGTAPGVALESNKTRIVILPGVPAEMKAIFDESVAPLIRERGEKRFYEREIHVDGIMESTIAPLIDEVMRESPGVYIKSHPKGEERKPHLDIHFSTNADNEEEAEKKLESAIKKLRELVDREKDNR
ncbi:MAG: nicotinamide mononucleotide deamidase-related protein [Candidatus Bathyarchaeia archaeon]